MYNCCEHCVHWNSFNTDLMEYEPDPEGRVNDHLTPCLYNDTLPNAQSCKDGKVKAYAS